MNQPVSHRPCPDGPGKIRVRLPGKAASRIADAAKAGANVVCLPELFATEYFCRNQDHAAFDLAEPIPGPTTEAMAAAAKATGTVVVAPLFERRGPGCYHNSLVVLGPDGSVLGRYRKMHIPHDPGFEEKFYFTPGDTGFTAVKTPYGPIGTLICWDQWFPEAARATALLGALVLVYPTAIGWHPSEKAEYGARQREAWMTVQRGHAIANGIYVAAINRVGIEGGGQATAKRSNFGARRFWPIRRDRSWPRPALTPRKSLPASSTRPFWKPPAATGRFCATGGWTPTAG